jgi:hypothetical protein
VDASVLVVWPDPTQFCAPIDTFPDEDVWQAATFDAVVHHTDRSQNNWLGVPAPGGPGAPRLKLIDNGYAFDRRRGACNSSFYAHLQGQDLPEAMTAALQRLLDEWHIEALEGLLDEVARKSIERRADLLLQRGALSL